MEFFNHYTSNTVGAGANQFFFSTEGEVFTSRVFYKVFSGGEYDYSFLYSNTIDSTFSDGKLSRCNIVCGAWDIHRARVAFCPEVTNTLPDEAFTDITFSQNPEKHVAPGEIFATDPVTLSPAKGDYICIELTYSGDMIPHHEENTTAAFVKKDGAWELRNRTPFPSMVGCTRKASLKIAYFGDSITQGIGTEFNSYTHWNAVLSEKLGENYAFWNLGIGFGRAADAATDGAWMYKVKQNDVAVVCFGVNDIFQTGDEEKIKTDLFTIVKKLKDAGIKVILQTVPPFDYSGEHVGMWMRINEYIKNELSAHAHMIFDTVPILGEKHSPQSAKYGGHPDKEGCRAWAEALENPVRSFIENLI